MLIQTDEFHVKLNDMTGGSGTADVEGGQTLKSNQGGQTLMSTQMTGGSGTDPNFSLEDSSYQFHLFFSRSQLQFTMHFNT